MSPRNDAVEIRIHGVSGTPPQELLGCAEVRQVAGDAIAGFYRPVQRGRVRDGDPQSDQAGGPLLEGYSWGGWTSGGPTRALWIVLLPFALINVSTRMLPPTKLYDKKNPNPDDKQRMGVDWKHRLVCGAIRVLALTMTVTVVFGVTQVAMITVGRRCADLPNVEQTGVEACYGVPIAVTGWLRTFSHSWQLGLSALIPVLVVGLLWRVSTKVTQRYEDVQPEVDIPTTVRPDDDTLPLGRRDLWRGSRRIRRLRLLHVQAAFATIAIMMGGIFPWKHSGMAVVSGLATLAATIVLVSYRPANQSPQVMRLGRWNWVMLGFTAAFVLVMLITGASDGEWAADPDRMVGTMNGWYLGIFAAQLALIFIVFLVLLKLGADGRKRVTRMHMRGHGTVVFAFLGCLSGALFNAGLLILAPIWLFTDSFVLGQGDIAKFLQDHPEWFGWTTLTAGYGIVAALVLVALVLLPYLVLAIRVFWIGAPAADVVHVDAQYADDLDGISAGVTDQVKRYVTNAPDGDDKERRDRDRDRRAREIRRIFWLARRVDYAPLAIWALMIGLAGVLVLQIIEKAVNMANPGAYQLLVAQETSGASTVKLPDLVAWGAFFAVVVLVGVIAVAAGSYRKAGTRRGVGVLWDLTCFWPRDVHPFAPPCYTERIVPEVSTRMATHLADRADRSTPAVVLAAHSQGTVISMAVLLAQPPLFQMDRVGLLTCGTVLDRLYARFFPRYFSVAAFEQLAERLRSPGQQGTAPVKTRWINLWRYSDYLGGVVPYESAGQERQRLAPIAGPVTAAVAAIHAAVEAADCAIGSARSAFVEAQLGDAAGAADRAAARAASEKATGDANSAAEVATDAAAAARSAAGTAAAPAAVAAAKALVEKLWTADDAMFRAQAAAAATIATASHTAARVKNADAAAGIAAWLARMAELSTSGAHAGKSVEAAKRAANAAGEAAKAARIAAGAAQHVASAMAGPDIDASRSSTVWPDNTPLRDPMFTTPPGDIIEPRPSRHSNYWQDPQFQETVDELIARVRATPAAADRA